MWHRDKVFNFSHVIVICSLYWQQWQGEMKFQLGCVIIISSRDEIFHIISPLGILTGLTPLHLNKKYRKWTDIFWVKIWMFSHKILKIDVTLNNLVPRAISPSSYSKKMRWGRVDSKVMLGHAVFQLSLNQNFLETFFALK